MLLAQAQERTASGAAIPGETAWPGFAACVLRKRCAASRLGVLLWASPGGGPASPPAATTSAAYVSYRERYAVRAAHTPARMPKATARWPGPAASGPSSGTVRSRPPGRMETSCSAMCFSPLGLTARSSTTSMPHEKLLGQKRGCTCCVSRQYARLPCLFSTASQARLRRGAGSQAGGSATGPRAGCALARKLQFTVPFWHLTTAEV